MVKCFNGYMYHILLFKKSFSFDCAGFKAAGFLFSFNLESDVQSLQNQYKIHHLPLIQHQIHYIIQIEQSIQFTQDLSKLIVMTVQSSSKDKRSASIKCFFSALFYSKSCRLFLCWFNDMCKHCRILQ